MSLDSCEGSGGADERVVEEIRRRNLQLEGVPTIHPGGPRHYDSDEVYHFGYRDPFLRAFLKIWHE